MLRKLFKKNNKTVVKARRYKTIIRWSNDTPWYVDLTKKDIERFESDPNVVRVDVLG